MESFTTMIMAGGRGERLVPLTSHRAKPAVRFGGIYYIIDFTLSNCINSGIRRIFVLAQFASSSLERLLRRGWSTIVRSEFSEFIELRPPQQLSGQEWYEGTADCIYKNIDVLNDERREGVLILSGDHIYQMDYRKMIHFHCEVNADITICCLEYPRNKASNLGVLTIDEKMNVLAFSEKPANPAPLPGDESKSCCNMGIYYFKREFLIDALKKDAQDPSSYHDFGKNIIPKLLEEKAHVAAYFFEDENKKENKYWRDIGTLDAYYEASMDLVTINPFFNLYNSDWPIWSFNAQLPPAKTVFNWRDSDRVGMALDSLLSPGVIISGGRVERSILSPEVRINSHSYIADSILFDRVRVGRGAVVRNAIVDSNVQIPAGTKIGVYPDEDRKRFTVSDNNVVIVTPSTIDAL